MNGVKRSFKLSTFLISTGIPSFDELLAEGILSGHSVFYGATETLDRLLRKLPDNITPVDEVNEETTDLKIAWRYQNVSNTKVSIFVLIPM
uniref:Elongator complex protein 4 n=1 Tax=Schistosoma japonicum TaxID=6182 RepID=Q5C1U9_SCHJA|nr:unknown [Schistosoma japonicum]